MRVRGGKLQEPTCSECCVSEGEKAVSVRLVILEVSCEEVRLTWRSGGAA